MGRGGGAGRKRAGARARARARPFAIAVASHRIAPPRPFASPRLARVQKKNQNQNQNQNQKVTSTCRTVRYFSLNMCAFLKKCACLHKKE